MRMLWILSCLAVTATAHAQRPSEAPGTAAPVALPESAVALDDYRWQVLVADAVVGTAALVAVHNESDAGVVIAGALYLATGPIVHSVHDRGGRALGSLAMRATLPIFGALVGGALIGNGARPCAPSSRVSCGDDDGGDDEAPVVGVLIGFGVGALTAMLIDAAFVARPVPVARPTWAPQVGVTRDRVSLGVAGRF